MVTNLYAIVSDVKQYVETEQNVKQYIELNQEVKKYIHTTINMNEDI